MPGNRKDDPTAKIDDSNDDTGEDESDAQGERVRVRDRPEVTQKGSCYG